MPSPPAVSAHRGGTERAGAATWQAYEDALLSGAEYVEFDIRRTVAAGYVVPVVERAVALLGEDGFVATTLEDRSVAAISRVFPRVRTALSLGRHRGGVGPARLARIRLSELLPMRRIRACGATGVAVHQRLARATVLREASRNGLFTMVWTVNEDRQMRAFLADPRVDVLITDRPRRALALRG
ncbi:glycerophosphodiester phosphodiesterase [Streptomyces sp. NPDC001928]|uniref:glycerophosphodiester phosphodiesterase n=1 Tax=Streptomyces sp. NPDC001928 TaxID=3154404 RepID=UPI00331874D3